MGELMNDKNSTDMIDSLDLVWGAEAIGVYIRRKKRQVWYLLEKGDLPARKVGGVWVASKEALRRSMTAAA